MHENEGINDKELEDTIGVDVGMKNEFVQEEKVGDPDIGMVFDTAKGLFEYYTKYGTENGFPIKKRDEPTACETSGNVHTTINDNGLIRRPQSVRGAGRPPFKRKTSKVEQAVKKLQENKKKEGKREQVVKMNQGKKKKRDENN
ncbi:hypothetical protein IFM89_017897 [Coptis chinensis]|uniref:Uncharacterized protein n=1 Tax=Coptis chinensis TaxID=261450 RepID=A0A835LVG1_9MAGN|nr:hypothetical protein IFM89_017897 [Coptis chinensis]